MNYFKIYYNLINTALLKKRKKTDEYFEAHHVKPQCKNGKFTVLLTAREHFIAHLLLTKIYKNDSSLAYAFNMMFMTSDNQQRIANSKWFDYKRKLFVANHPCKSDKVRNKIRESLKLYNANKYIGQSCLLNTCKYCNKTIKQSKRFCSDHCAETYFLNNNSEEKYQDVVNKCKICNNKLTRQKYTCGTECFNIFKKYFPDYSMSLSKSRSNYINNNYDKILITNKKIAENKDFNIIGKKISDTKRKKLSGNNLSSVSEIIIYDKVYNEINYKDGKITLKEFCYKHNYDYKLIQQSYLKNKRIPSGTLKDCIAIKLKG